MIDKNGKLFGLINVIDIIIVSVLVIACVFVFQKFFANTDVSSDLKTVKISIFNEELPDYIANQIKMGDAIMDESKSINLGIVDNIQIEKGFVYVPTDDGKIIKTYKEDYSNIEVSSTLNAKVSPNGVFVNGNRYAIGHGFSGLIGDTKYYFRISNIEY